MVISEILGRANNLMKVSIHQLIHNVNIIKVLPLRRPYDVLNFNNLRNNMKESHPQSSGEINILHFKPSVAYTVQNNETYAIILS